MPSLGRTITVESVGSHVSCALSCMRLPPLLCVRGHTGHRQSKTPKEPRQPSATRTFCGHFAHTPIALYGRLPRPSTGSVLVSFGTVRGSFRCASSWIPTATPLVRTIADGSVTEISI